MFGAYGRSLYESSITFVSEAAFADQIKHRFQLQKKIMPVSNCRKITKKDMIHNDATPQIEVNPETYEVKVDGAAITCEPATVLPMAQRYFLF
jgi:urease subunit alpha